MKTLRTIVIAWICGLFFNVHCTAAPQDIWRVEPDTCLLSEQESTCVMQVKITLLQQVDTDLCVFISSKKSGCFIEQTRSMLISVDLVDDTKLTLRNNQGISVASHALTLTTLASANFNRRVRLPWSLF